MMDEEMESKEDKKKMPKVAKVVSPALTPWFICH